MDEHLEKNVTRIQSLMLICSYTFKTMLKIDGKEYKKAQSKVIAEMEYEKNKKMPLELLAVFEAISEPNNMALYHMILVTLVAGVFENYDLKEKEMPGFRELFREDMIIECEKNYKDITLEYFVRRLRNSVVHLNYEFGDGRITFEDGYKGQKKDFRFKLTKLELSKLIDAICYYCARNCPPLNKTVE